MLLIPREDDVLLLLQSLIGAVGMTAFTYVLPFFLHVMLAPTPISPSRKVCARAQGVSEGRSRPRDAMISTHLNLQRCAPCSTAALARSPPAL